MWTIIKKGKCTVCNGNNFLPYFYNQYFFFENYIVMQCKYEDWGANRSTLGVQYTLFQRKNQEDHLKRSIYTNILHICIFRANYKSLLLCARQIVLHCKSLNIKFCYVSFSEYFWACNTPYNTSFIPGSVYDLIFDNILTMYFTDKIIMSGNPVFNLSSQFILLTSSIVYQKPNNLMKNMNL